MSNVWFTADQHFDHDGIVELCKRPFKSTRHMNKDLIRNYNYHVEADDTVYINESYENPVVFSCRDE